MVRRLVVQSSKCGLVLQYCRPAADYKFSCCASCLLFAKHMDAGMGGSEYGRYAVAYLVDQTNMLENICKKCKEKTTPLIQQTSTVLFRMPREFASQD
jgi:hypothetical protein